VLGSVVVTIVGSTIVVRLLGPGRVDPDSPATTAASVATRTDG